MFAPPMRPNSAASQHPQYNHQPSQPHHQHQQAPSLSRRRSLSWDQQQGGLPPPPSEIDHYDLSRHLIASPSNRNISLPNHNHGGYQDLEPSSERDTRQLPMNSVSKHPKLKLEVILSSTVFEAGGQIDGRLEITSATSQRLRLGEIAVELEGVEGGSAFSFDWSQGAGCCVGEERKGAALSSSMTIQEDTGRVI